MSAKQIPVSVKDSYGNSVDDNKKRWALFIYYSCDKKEYNAFYKCFQSKEKDIKESITSLKHDILL